MPSPTTGAEQRPPLDLEGMLRARRPRRGLCDHRRRGRARPRRSGPHRRPGHHPDPAAANLERLAAALRDMGGGLRVAGLEEPVACDFDASSIARFSSMATRGRFGDLDVVVNPDGIPGGYAQLSANALREPADGLTIAIAKLDDLVAARRGAAHVTGLSHYKTAAQRLVDLGSRRAASAQTDAPRPPKRAPSTGHASPDQPARRPAQQPPAQPPRPKRQGPPHRPHEPER